MGIGIDNNPVGQRYHLIRYLHICCSRGEIRGVDFQWDTILVCRFGHPGYLYMGKKDTRMTEKLESFMMSLNGFQPGFRYSLRIALEGVGMGG